MFQGFSNYWSFGLSKVLYDRPAHYIVILRISYNKYKQYMNRKRLHSRSNQALLLTTAPESPSIPYTLPHQLQQKQLFKQSFEKIHKIKSILIKNTSKQLMQQLNDIIDLIKGQRVKAKFMIQQLGKINDKDTVQLCCDVGVNTDSILPGFQDQEEEEGVVQGDKAVQTQQQQETSEMHKYRSPCNSNRKFEYYYKLVCMIDKLKVDYRKILPILPNLPESYILPDVDSNICNYRVLKTDEIIKLQTVFISKFNTMIQNQISKSNQKQRQQQKKKKHMASSPGNQKEEENRQIKDEDMTDYKGEATKKDSKNEFRNKIGVERSQKISKILQQL